MKQLAFVLVALVVLVAMALVDEGFGQTGPAALTTSSAAPNGVTIPDGYRAWQLITVAREEGKLDDLRAILGNDIAVNAARAGKEAYPDGAILARLAWSYEPLAESAQAFGQPQSHVVGHPKNGLQLMVKHSSRYASTGGWGFAQFDGGKPSPQAVQNSCFACHSVVKNRDFVFNRYATTGEQRP